MERVAAANEEALEAWDGVLFDRFLKFRDIVTNGLIAKRRWRHIHRAPARGCSTSAAASAIRALREALDEFDGPNGVVAGASTWIISAKVP